MMARNMMSSTSTLDKPAAAPRANPSAKVKEREREREKERRHEGGRGRWERRQRTENVHKA